MRLIPDWKDITLKAYSMWANYLGILALLAPEIIYALFEIDTNPRFWWLLGLALIVSGIAGRILDQKIDGQYRSDKRLAAPAAILLALAVSVPAPPAQSGILGDLFKAMSPAPVVEVSSVGVPYSDAAFNAVAVPHIARWEGEHRCRDDPSMHCAYLDTIAEPDLPTACFGETRGIKMGMRFTDDQCNDMLARGVGQFRKGLHAYFAAETKAKRLTPHRDAAYTSLAYNAGIRGAGRSTATRRLNAGDIAGGCSALAWWNKSGGRIVRGLVNRRGDEVAMCRRGLA